MSPATAVKEFRYRRGSCVGTGTLGPLATLGLHVTCSTHGGIEAEPSICAVAAAESASWEEDRLTFAMEGTDSEVLAWLAKDRLVIVVLMVIENPAANAVVIKKLCEHPNELVREEAARRFAHEQQGATS